MAPKVWAKPVLLLLSNAGGSPLLVWQCCKGKAMNTKGTSQECRAWHRNVTANSLVSRF